jgi:L-lactate dehydrogenase complex protein LldF
MASDRELLTEKIAKEIANREGSDKLWRTMERSRNNRAVAIETLRVDVEEMKRGDREVKVGVAADPGVVDQFANAVRKNGGQVFMAKTGDDAMRYVAEVAKRAGTKLVVKSKSLTTEEIEFNHHLEKEGIRCVETDLGELIVQLSHEKPVHLVAPAAHKSLEDVVEIFSKELKMNLPPDAEVILREVRKYLRPLFLSAEMGVTGANIGIAESGTMIIETNEGNARLVSSAPKVHVVIIGMEKVVRSWEDAARLVSAHAISATGQVMTVYVSMISQHVPLAGSSEGRELHVVILDNGRSRMRDDEWFSDALNCIRCGACMNICPTYGIVGGHIFGYIYPGPIGIPWTAEVHGLDKATFAHLCISCGLCKEICPVDIDMPLMIAKVKEEEVQKNGQLRVNSFFTSSERLAAAASATAPLSNWMLRRGLTRYLMERLVGVDRRRTLPSFSRRRLRDRLSGSLQGSGEAGKVVFFPDINADYNDPELGERAVRMLRSAGYHVEVPELAWSGMPFISYGEVAKATKVAKENLQRLKGYLSQGYRIVSTEPTAIYMLREVYPKLVPGEESAAARERSVGFFALLEELARAPQLKASFPVSDTVGFHIPCHERALSSGRPAIRFLERAGYSVRVVETGTCCGMAGTFGMKKGPLGYDLSMAVGDRLFERFKESACRIVATESSVCATQINDGAALKVLHPLYFVEPT